MMHLPYKLEVTKVSGSGKKVGFVVEEDKGKAENKASDIAKIWFMQRCSHHMIHDMRGLKEKQDAAML
ncbi:hypothetical protein C0989_006468 [Termitomyces sp. Mn162]|nr:hypothetical protein C0989_006468 [Termitomyces sp. Mn162]